MDLPIVLENNSTFVTGVMEMQQDLYLLLKEPIKTWYQSCRTGSYIPLHSTDAVELRNAVKDSVSQLRGIEIGIVEMTEPMWRPFTDWFTKNFPKLSEGIQWVMHAVGEILDFALTLKELYNKYYGNATDEQKEAMEEAGIVAASAATGFAVAGVPGLAAGALVGSFAAAAHDIDNQRELTEKYEAARKEYETALKNENLTALERQRIKTEVAELDYLYQQKNAEFLKRESYRNNLAQRSMTAPTGMAYNPMQMDYLNPKYKETYEGEQKKYQDMQNHPEWFDNNGNYDLGGMTGSAFNGLTSNLAFSDTNGDAPNIVSNNTFITTEVTVQPSLSPLDIK